ncbi:MAG: 30S ribosomal protein THX [Gammaproteobacteria bacterium]|nr:30S ribosomal protein THX [Gammaproteobacteria bacterium]
MGKGDSRTRRGKIIKGSFGKKRLKTEKKRTKKRNESS